MGIRYVLICLSFYLSYCLTFLSKNLKYSFNLSIILPKIFIYFSLCWNLFSSSIYFFYIPTPYWYVSLHIYFFFSGHHFLKNYLTSLPRLGDGIPVRYERNSENFGRLLGTGLLIGLAFLMFRFLRNTRVSVGGMNPFQSMTKVGLINPDFTLHMQFFRDLKG